MSPTVPAYPLCTPPIPCAKSQQSGFTLLEILIVLVVIGILTTMAGSVLLPGFEQRRLRVQLETLADQLAFAQHRAILSGRPYGVVANDEGYAFVTYRSQQWEPAYEASIQPQVVTGLLVNSSKEGLPDLPIKPSGNVIEKADALQPNVILSPIGEPLPIDFILSDGVDGSGAGWRLYRDIDDAIKLMRWPINSESDDG